MKYLVMWKEKDLFALDSSGIRDRLSIYDCANYHSVAELVAKHYSDTISDEHPIIVYELGNPERFKISTTVERWSK